MSLPIIMVVGEAGSGKDTVSGMLVKHLNGVCIAQADPMKRFAAEVFGFDKDQLWGPSECRNATDTRFADLLTRNKTLRKLNSDDDDYVNDWIAEVIDIIDYGDPYWRLMEWGEAILKDAENGLTPRKVLQTLGTEWGRNCSPNMWINYAASRALKLLNGGHAYDQSIGLIENDNPGYGSVIITDGRFRNEILAVKKLGGKVIKIINPVPAKINEAELAGVVGHKSESEQRRTPEWFFDAILVNDKSIGLDSLEQKVLSLAVGLFKSSVY